MDTFASFFLFSGDARDCGDCTVHSKSVRSRVWGWRRGEILRLFEYDEYDRVRGYSIDI